jgi:hypothetical protein
MKTPAHKKFEASKHGSTLVNKLRAAMSKAGEQVDFWLDPAGCIQDSWRDYTGIMVYANSKTEADRVAAWIVACLNKHGFGAWRDGALRAGEVEIRHPFTRDSKIGSTLVCLGSWPIGD